MTDVSSYSSSIMKTSTYKTEEGVVKNLRKIRDEISIEIKDMTFEQERAYLDKLLAERSRQKG